MRHKALIRTVLTSAFLVVSIMSATGVLGAAVVPGTISPSGAGYQDSTLMGRWDGPYEWPVVAIHAFLLPTGKVLHFAFPGEIQYPSSYIWDPETWEFTPAPVNRPLFCSGHSYLADGRLLVTGGNGPAPEGEFRGIRDAHIFDAFSETWTRVEDMADGRWYPSNVTLADGRVLVFSGLDELTGAINGDIEVYNPDSAVVWQVVDEEPLPLYPRLYMLSSGDVFYSGPSQVTGIYEIDTWSWYLVQLSNFGSRYDGMSVPLPPGRDRVMLIGGRSDTLVTGTAEIIDFNDSIPTWRYTQSMNFARMHANAVILPDGTILVAGGHGSLHEEKDLESTAVYKAEIYDPATETWSIMAPLTRPRMYHSTAVLLPDARVLLGGSNGEFTTEIYSPPYLFRGARPVIEFAPTEIAYGSTFGVQFTSTTGTNTFVAIRLTAVTHSVNMDQRYVHLAELSSGDGIVIVPAPPNSSLAPPGYYMLFVVDSDGVPSKAQMVRFQFDPVGCCLGVRGDIDGSGEINVSDLTYLVDYLFGEGPAPLCSEEADVDGSGSTDVADLTYLVDYLFRGGPSPAPCP